MELGCGLIRLSYLNYPDVFFDQLGGFAPGDSMSSSTG
jgi:hypothetical protein